MQTEEEVGRQHQGMDTPGVRQVPEGSGEQGKMEETGSEIICDAPTTLFNIFLERNIKITKALSALEAEQSPTSALLMTLMA